MNLKNRIEKLEEAANQSGKELIVGITNFSENAGPFSDPDDEIARQRAEGKKVIVVELPYGYEWGTRP